MTFLWILQALFSWNVQIFIALFIFLLMHLVKMHKKMCYLFRFSDRQTSWKSAHFSLSWACQRRFFTAFLYFYIIYLYVIVYTIKRSVFYEKVFILSATYRRARTIRHLRRTDRQIKIGSTTEHCRTGRIEEISYAEVFWIRR